VTDSGSYLGVVSGDPRLYRVVRRSPGLVGVWPYDSPLPSGWHPEGEPAPRERCAALAGGGAPPGAADLSPDGTFPEVFERVVRWRGAAAAVVFEDVVVGFAELNARANRLARRLVDLGVGPEVLVAIAVPRSVELVVALLAVLKAGGAYLAVDPAYPRERIAYMLADSRPTLLLRGADNGLPVPVALEVVVDAVDAGHPDHDLVDSDRIAPLRVDHPLYVIYTSGSTGTPKAVVVTAAGLGALVDTQRRTVAPGPGDRVLQWASVSFDVAFWDLTLGLLSGATLVLAAADDLLPGDSLEQTLLRQAITCATLPPVALSATRSDWALAGGTVVSTGDVCTGGLAARWAPGRRMFNGYGPTETTIGATIGPVVDGEVPNVGRPFDRYVVRLLDDDLRPVPDGQPGEICIGGPGLARGYLGNPALTAQRFVPDPLGRNGSRLYRSGDYGVLGADGLYRFAGRVDNQVKVRGFRVELSEVETALATHPAVAVAAVLVRGELEMAVLVGYVMATTPGEHVTGVQLRDHVAGRLPAHMVPASVVVLDRLPTTANGKVDREALRREHHPAAAPALEPGSDFLTELVCRLVAELVEQNPIAPSDNFHEVGGNSILAGRLAGRIRDELGLRVPIRAVLEADDIAGIAALVGRHAEKRTDIV
jgi:amino acid adenylation domain-containing protein